MIITKLFIVYGRVQGVGFRYFTWKEATKLGIKGTVKNLSDGNVQVIAQGESDKINLFREWLSKGPRTADVKDLIEKDYTDNNIYDDFSISY